MASYTLPDSRVPVLQAGNFTLPWYLFLNNIFNSTGQGSGGTANQVLHGANSGYSAVSLASDVSGVLPLANGGTSVSISPVITQVLIAQSPTSALWKSISGDAGILSSGKVTVSGTNGVAFTVYATAAVGQLPGTATNDNANAGNIGEYVASTVTSGAAVTLTSTVVTNITSVSLTAGDWDISTSTDFTLSSVNAVTLVGGTSLVSATLPSQGGTASLGPDATGNIFVPLSGQTVTNYDIDVIPVRALLTQTTVAYLVTQATFSAGAASAFGTIRARRMR